MSDELQDVIKENATGPRSAEVDGVRTRQHSLKDQIAADKYLASKRAGGNPAAALKRAKLIPPGTV